MGSQTSRSRIIVIGDGIKIKKERKINEEIETTKEGTTGRKKQKEKEQEERGRRKRIKE